MAVVVDTSAFFALADARDDNHAASAAVLDDLESDDLVLSNYVASETLSLVHRRLGMERARIVQRSAIQLIGMLWTTQLEHAAAVEAFLESGRSLSFVDCATMATMRARALDTIFTFDADFTRAGFTTIP